MRQGAVLFSVILAMTVVGCGGSGGSMKSTGLSTTPSLTAASSPASGSTNAPSGTSGGSSSASGSTPSAGAPAGNPSPTSATSATEVVVSSPADGATVSSPAQVVASATGSTAISSMQLYVDDAVSAQAPSAQIATALQLPNGAHTIVAQAWDQNGNSYKSAPVHIMASTSAPQPSASAANFSQIQTLDGWDNCDVCAGAAGNGPHTAHSMQQGIGSPSLSGAAARFDIGGTAWGAALFWRELGSHDDAQNLRYDLDFYIDDTSSGQALEFDVNQTAGGNKYIFGTECDFRDSGTWRVWNAPAGAWASTGVPCPVPATNTWHHLTWELQRSGGQAHFIAVTLDGNRQDVGMSFDAMGQGGTGLDVAFQADLTASGGNESVWLDNVSLSW